MTTPPSPPGPTTAALPRPDCYVCAHRREVPGSAHSSCAHPAASEQSPVASLMSIFASVGRGGPVIGNGAKELEIKANPHGVAHGWFNWPFNFDPVWLLGCKGMTPRTPTSAEEGDRA